MPSARIRQTDNTQRTDPVCASAKRDYQVMQQQLRYWLNCMQDCIGFAWGFLMLPFRLIGGAWRFLVGCGIAIVRGVINFCFAGLACAVFGTAFFIVYQTVTHYH